ncbi:MAG: DOMON domain-containing protein [Candidatus Stygibacter australis]|nr:DOMON domain-containing protein [Candidatus Stygibacter australis]
MKFKILIFSLLVVMVFYSGCNRLSDEIMGPDEVIIDSLGFSEVSAAGVTFKYKVEDTDLHCILSGNTSGWLSVGINPSSQMKNGNFIMGYVSDGTGYMRDDWGISNTTHVSDISLNGEDNITMIAASESGGISELEFTIPLNSGDQYDQVLEIDQTYPVILARGNNDDFDSMHSATGYANITISTTGGGNGGDGHTSVMPDTTQYLHLETSGMKFYWLVDTDTLYCVVTAPTTGWVGIGFDQDNVMQNANFIIGYVESDSIGYFRDDWGSEPTIHVSDESMGGTSDLYNMGGIEANGESIIYFSIPLDSGDSYDKPLAWDESYPIILAYGSEDSFMSMHTAAEFSSFTVDNTTGGGGTGNTTAFPDTTQYLSLKEGDISYYWLVDPDTIHVLVSAPTTGWVGIGFDQDNVMQGANFIIGYVENDTIGYLRDDWGNTPSVHSSDIVNGGTEDIYHTGGLESGGETFIYFSMPLNSGDPYDKPLAWDESYPVILAYGLDDDFSAMHTGAEFSSFTVDNTTGGGGGGGGNTHTFPDTTLYLSLETIGMKYYWLVDPDTIHVVVSAPTNGWVAIGFDQVNVMQGANFIIGYVENDSIGYLRDDWGNTPTVHSADVNNGGTEDIYFTGGLETGGETFIYFSMPLDSGDPYDKPLNWDENYPVILAYGNDDSFSSMHANAGFSSFTVDNTTGGGENGVTTGGDISLDDDTLGFNVVYKSGFTFKWKIVGDSLRCMLEAPTTGWLAVGFDPSEEMQDANFIIGYVDNGITYIRDDFGVSEILHSADLGLGGENNVRRVFGHEESGSSEMRFTIPLNSGDMYDRAIVPGNEYKVIFAHGFNGADDFNSMHAEAEDEDVQF